MESREIETGRGGRMYDKPGCKITVESKYRIV